MWWVRTRTCWKDQSLFAGYGSPKFNCIAHPASPTYQHLVTPDTSYTHRASCIITRTGATSTFQDTGEPRTLKPKSQKPAHSPDVGFAPTRRRRSQSNTIRAPAYTYTCERHPPISRLPRMGFSERVHVLCRIPSHTANHNISRQAGLDLLLCANPP